jgi:hypothetical protein
MLLWGFEGSNNFRNEANGKYSNLLSHVLAIQKSEKAPSMSRKF